MYRRTITIGSAGKAFSVTGWKLGVKKTGKLFLFSRLLSCAGSLSHIHFIQAYFYVFINGDLPNLFSRLYVKKPGDFSLAEQKK
ncbi:hypothetical protein LOAG_16632 [Loa loa]|uniref:Uncharacterized protein n=1 Tax=Loa loa TaxID=7209 RepID=A0A1S0UNH3_LOALO|nr:hypothetical protein LOAG_16632 [Loa loa]EJD76394.1 hypothetical protein LOAG_16632 [Loa loa]